MSEYIVLVPYQLPVFCLLLDCLCLIMRLVKIEDNGELILPLDLIRGVPKYAILSHTWAADGDEVTLWRHVRGFCEDEDWIKERSSSAERRLVTTACDTSRSTLAALIRRTIPNYLEQSTPCSTGIRMCSSLMPMRREWIGGPTCPPRYLESRKFLVISSHSVFLGPSVLLKSCYGLRSDKQHGKKIWPTVFLASLGSICRYYTAKGCVLLSDFSKST
jgi:hypothetical protein